MALALAFAGSVLAVAGASQASAAVPGLVRITGVSALDDLSPKFATATCPAGKVLVGTGYRVDFATGEVVVDDLLPNGSTTTAPTAVTVGAYEEDPVGTPWQVLAFAVCANPVSGLVRIPATSVSNSSDFDNATAACPAGKVMLGTGYELNGALGEVVVDDFRPNGSTTTAPTAVTVGAYEADPNFPGNWTITAYAICAFPVPGLVRVPETSPSGSENSKDETAVCPAGKVLTGTGHELTGATGEVVIDDLAPNGNASTPPNSLFIDAFEADPDFPGNWTVTAYAICATQ
ncbi:hypothetical protein GCM10027569_03980 [Flindersiella endophytica]